MNILIVSILAYLIVSFPTAFLVLMKFHNLDITKEGSGNVGTLNSFELTNSKKVALIVLIVDLFKGMISVFIAKYFFSNDFLTSSIALNFSILGHCYSPWIKFKGGRGLATAAGGSLLLSPIIPIIWLISWFITKKISRDIHIANIGATLTIILSVILFTQPLNFITFPPAEKSFIFIFSISLMMLIILSKHINPLREILIKNKIGK